MKLHKRTPYTVSSHLPFLLHSPYQQRIITSLIFHPPLPSIPPGFHLSSPLRLCSTVLRVLPRVLVAGHWAGLVSLAFLLCCCLPSCNAITVPGVGDGAQSPLWAAWSDGTAGYGCVGCERWDNCSTSLSLSLPQQPRGGVLELGAKKSGLASVALPLSRAQATNSEPTT
jgi:hypothetical protein